MKMDPKRKRVVCTDMAQDTIKWQASCAHSTKLLASRKANEFLKQQILTFPEDYVPYR